MTRAIVIIALVALAANVHSQTTVTNLFPNGDFSAGGPTADWVEVNGGGDFTYSYPADGGNPDNYGVIDATAAGSGWGIWVGGDIDPIPLWALGLTAGTRYTFVQDMKILSGNNIGGLKVESWGPNGEILPNSGDMRPTAGSTEWETYTFEYTISPNATGLKIVPLWGPDSSVGFDNLGVVTLASSPLTATIQAPLDGATVSTNFTILASAVVAPGLVISVDFYLGTDLLGTEYLPPFSLNVEGAPEGPAVLTVVATDDSLNTVTSAPVNVTVVSDVVESIVRVDPAAGWTGWMNVRETPQNFNGEAFSSAWGVTDLTAVFSGSGPESVLTLKPAPVNDTNVFWYDYTVEPLLSDPTDFEGAVGFKEMEANMYVQVSDGSLNGHLVTFTGVCITNTLDIQFNPGSTNRIGNGWTNYAFVKDFAPDFSSVNESFVALTSDAPFSVSLETLPDATRHIQYGFVTRGPNVWPTDVDKYGVIEIQSLDVTSTDVVVDSSADWRGFMNVFETPQAGQGFVFGNPWGTEDLRAVFTSQGLELSPNTIGDPDPFWYTPSGGPGAVGNKTMDASMYVELGSLPGRKLVFSGNVLSNTLVSASNTNALGNGWTSVAFIKDFAPDFSSAESVTVPLTPGPFSIELNTINDPARVVQYGFQTVGPNVWITDVAPFGLVLIENVGVAPTSITPSLVNGNINLSFPTQLGKTYTALFKTNLTDATWSTLTVTNGTGMEAVISDPADDSQRYYQLSIE